MRQQKHQHLPTLTVVAILGTDALVEDSLARLLEREGYATRHLEAAYPTGRMDELLDGVDVMILAPGQKESVGEAFLEAMRSTPKTAAIPVLAVSSALKLAMLDELSANAPWRSLFDELVCEIEAAQKGAVDA
jgi:hypothetical protein